MGAALEGFRDGATVFIALPSQTPAVVRDRQNQLLGASHEVSLEAGGSRVTANINQTFLEEQARAEKDLADAQDKLSHLQTDSRILQEEVTEEDIARVISSWTGIPVSRLQEGEREKLVKMEERIGERVVGQSNAIVAVSNAVRRARAGLQDENRPIGSFLFLGPTGVGKTAVALPNCIRQKRRCMSGVAVIVRTASLHGPLVAVADQCDQTASPDRLRPSRYSFFVAVCMVSLSEKSISTACLSVLSTCSVCWPSGSY